MDKNDAGRQQGKVCPACKKPVRWEVLKEANFGSEGGYEHHRVAYCKTAECRKHNRPVDPVNAPL